MDKVKQFWKDVVREREDYWCSFFRKYEEDDKNADVNSYMDNTSKRIATLLKLAEEDVSQSENSQVQVQHYYEEQPGEPSSGDNQSNSTSVDIIIETVISQSLLESTTTNIPLTPSKKKFNPSFVTEIFGEEEELTNKLQISPTAKKFKLFHSPPSRETTNCITSIAMNDSAKSQSTENLESSISERSTTCVIGDNIKYVCRRVRSRSNTDVSTPKRFKLA